MSEPKTLKYYLEHTDEMPTDPKVLEQLANEHMNAALESGGEQLTVDKLVGKADEPGSAVPKEEVSDQAKADAEKIAADAKAEADAKAAEEAAAAADEAKVVPLKLSPDAEAAKAKALAEGKQWIDGVLSKDGLHVLPFSVVSSTRSRAETAEKLVKLQAEEIAALKSAKENSGGVVDAGTLTEEELAALEAESPTLANVLHAQQAAIRELKEAQQKRAEAEEAAIRSQVQDAIDANPTLAGWQADMESGKDRALWDEAHRIDLALRKSPKYADMSFADRFKKVVELTQVAQGIEPEPRVEPRVEPTSEQVKAAAAAKLAAAAKAGRPVTLSDIPGGAPPAVDERQKVEEMSSVALGQQFLSMTKEQMDTYLATL